MRTSSTEGDLKNLLLVDDNQISNKKCSNSNNNSLINL